ncbi:MAG: hypothetical protein ACI90V_000929 [Bacillariaceae sp.]|jgi:hypothetical protein
MIVIDNRYMEVVKANKKVKKGLISRVISLFNKIQLRYFVEICLFLFLILVFVNR